jgi:hypothetical protein
MATSRITTLRVKTLSGTFAVFIMTNNADSDTM